MTDMQTENNRHSTESAYAKVVNPDENARRIAIVEKYFGTNGIKLSQPNRILVGEGILTKMCRKRPKPRHFFLFTDIVVYGTIVVQRKMLSRQHVIHLEDVAVDDVEDSGALKHGFVINSPSKSFTVYTTTAEEKTQWMSHIRKCANDSAGRERNRLSIKSPVWIPDSEASTCMVCRQSEFTLINRRHHCRKCGKVVCDRCSNYRWLLPNQGTERQRICRVCHDELERERRTAETRVAASAVGGTRRESQIQSPGGAQQWNDNNDCETARPASGDSQQPQRSDEVESLAAGEDVTRRTSPNQTAVGDDVICAGLQVPRSTACVSSVFIDNPDELDKSLTSMTSESNRKSSQEEKNAHTVEENSDDSPPIPV